MSVTDPIADLLTRIRNANQMRYNEVVIPSSNVKLQIVKILKNEGYINGKGFPVLEMTITTRDFDINVSEAIQSMLKENLG